MIAWLGLLILYLIIESGEGRFSWLMEFPNFETLRSYFHTLQSSHETKETHNQWERVLPYSESALLYTKKREIKTLPSWCDEWIAKKHER